MKLESMVSSVEGKIVHLLKKFKEKPAVFLSKSDVMCFLYYLLITDPFLNYSPTIRNLAPTVERSKTFLVHAGLEASIEGQNKQVALCIGESQKDVELQAWDFLVGVEIEYNTGSLPKNPTLLMEDIEKLATFKKGYLLWLNWSYSLDNDDIRIVEELVAKHDNVRLYYLDLCSKPIKTNVKKIV
jgi:hypothetical protein